MLFCNLETSYSMAHLIKHLKQNCTVGVADFHRGFVVSRWQRVELGLRERTGLCLACLHQLAEGCRLPRVPWGPGVSSVLRLAGPGAPRAGKWLTERDVYKGSFPTPWRRLRHKGEKNRPGLQTLSLDRMSHFFFWRCAGD